MMRGAAPILIYLLLPAVLTSWARGDVGLEIQTGFGGIFQLGQPFPLIVRVVNSGPALEGAVEVVESRGGPARGIRPYRLTQRKEVFVSAQSEKRVVFTVDPDSVARFLRVRFINRGQHVERSVSLRGVFTPTPLILLLTRNNVTPTVPVPHDAPVPIVSVSPQELPTDPRAYAGVWALVIYEQSLRDLSRLQQESVKRWLSTGGTMVMLGGLHYALYQEPVTAQFLPVDVLGLKRLEALPALEGAYGSPLADLWVQESRVTNGTILVHEKGTPLVVQGTHGRGKVTYLALDVGRPPVSQWQGLPAVFADLLGTPPTKTPDTWTTWNESVFSRLLQRVTLLGIHSPLLAFFLALVVYMGGLVLWFRFWQGYHFRGLRWVGSVLGFVLVCALAGFFYFDRGVGLPDGVLISATVVEGDALGFTHAQTNLGVFSTRPRDYAIKIPRGWLEFDFVPSQSSEVSPTLVLEDESHFSSLRFPLAAWSSGLFKIRSASSFPIRIALWRSRDGFSLRLGNLGGKLLKECWLVLSGRGYPLGDVPPGGRLAREIALSDVSQESGASSRLTDIGFTDRVREQILKDSIFSQDEMSAETMAGTAFVIGWVESGAPFVGSDDSRVKTHHYTMFRATLPMPGEEDQ